MLINKKNYFNKCRLLGNLIDWLLNHFIFCVILNNNCNRYITGI